MSLETSPFELGVGTRFGWQKGPRLGLESPQNSASISVPASTGQSTAFNIKLTAQQLDILQVVAIGAFLGANDASGKLTIGAVMIAVGVTNAAGSVGGNNGLAVNYQPPPVLTFPVDASSVVSLSIVNPPPLRFLDLVPLNFAVVNPSLFCLTFQVSVINSDAGAAHSYNANFQAIARIINGGDSI